MAETGLSSEAVWSSTNSEELEQRLQRLEEAVARLCDDSVIEERFRKVITKEVRAEIERFNEERTKIFARKFAENKHWDRSSAASPPVRGFFSDVWSDASLLFRMIWDPYFVISWWGKTIPLAALAYVTVMPWLPSFLPPIPVLSQLDDLLVIYFGFKVLGHELRRYREFLSAIKGSD